MTLPGLTPQWTLGDRLRKAREIAGLNQTQLADELEIARNSVGRYESGDYDPPRTVIIAWALRTGVDFEWLLGDHQGRKRGGYTDVASQRHKRPHYQHQLDRSDDSAPPTTAEIQSFLKRTPLVRSAEAAIGRSAAAS